MFCKCEMVEFLDSSWIELVGTFSFVSSLWFVVIIMLMMTNKFGSWIKQFSLRVSKGEKEEARIYKLFRGLMQLFSSPWIFSSVAEQLLQKMCKSVSSHWLRGKVWTNRFQCLRLPRTQEIIVSNEDVWKALQASAFESFILSLKFTPAFSWFCQLIWLAGDHVELFWLRKFLHRKPIDSYRFLKYNSSCIYLWMIWLYVHIVVAYIHIPRWAPSALKATEGRMCSAEKCAGLVTTSVSSSALMSAFKWCQMLPLSTPSPFFSWVRLVLSVSLRQHCTTFCPALTFSKFLQWAGFCKETDMSHCGRVDWTVCSLIQIPTNNLNTFRQVCNFLN